MWLHSHMILWTEYSKIEDGHQADNRGTTGLMSTNFHRVRIGTQLVGIVDHIRGEPQDPLGYGLQMSDCLWLHRHRTAEERCYAGHRRVPSVKTLSTIIGEQALNFRPECIEILAVRVFLIRQQMLRIGCII